MNSSYDIVIVGAGPTGSTAARFAAKNGAKVLLLEKDREIGIPVRCAEGVGEKGILTVVDLEPSWIAKKITGITLNSPSGQTVQIDSNEVGYILDRKRFDYDLAQIAAKEGADVLTKAYVYDLLFDNGTVCGCKVEHLGEKYEIKAKIVIGADGLESRVGRWAGLKTSTSMADMETCAQVTAQNIDVNDNYCHMYFGKDMAPGGYIWIFPKGNGLANVGLGISGIYAKEKPPIYYLDKFLKTHFPKAAILTTVAGGVPCSATLDEIVADGLMLVGDAAHQVNPVSGGGIVNGMIAAKIAGQVAAKAVQENDISKKRLEEYAKQWYNAEGNKNKLFYKLKNYVFKMTDDDLEETANILLKLPVGKRTLFNIFKSALFKKPSLIMDALKAFS